MPTYDYKCTKCHRSFAVEQSIRDAALKKCKECGGKLEKQLPKGVNLIFRGTGFYATDYKNKGRGGAGGAKPDSRKQEASDKASDKGGKD